MSLPRPVGTSHQLEKIAAQPWLLHSAPHLSARPPDSSPALPLACPWQSKQEECKPPPQQAAAQELQGFWSPSSADQYLVEVSAYHGIPSLISKDSLQHGHLFRLEGGSRFRREPPPCGLGFSRLPWPLSHLGFCCPVTRAQHYPPPSPSLTSSVLGLWHPPCRSLLPLINCHASWLHLKACKRMQATKEVRLHCRDPMNRKLGSQPLCRFDPSRDPH